MLCGCGCRRVNFSSGAVVLVEGLYSPRSAEDWFYSQTDVVMQLGASRPCDTALISDVLEAMLEVHRAAMVSANIDGSLAHL